MKPAAEFRPSVLVRHHQIQSILATKSPRRSLWLKRGSRMEAVSEWQVMEVGGGVRLTGMYARQPEGIAVRGLCVLIHGWEGSHDSSYLYSMACQMYAQGCNVFRLNLRDHGGTHALNEAPFHSARMDEVLGAVKHAQSLDATGAPLVVIGFSLGGNFALRVGLQGPAQGIAPALSIGISPAIHPGSTLVAIDEGPALFRAYFIDKWRKTLRAKQAAWPKFDAAAYEGIQSFVGITERFVQQHTDYASLDDYLGAYTLTPDLLMASPSPLAIITSRDDAVIPIRYFDGLSTGGSLKHFLVTDRGGHCGFIEDLRLTSWAETQVVHLLKTVLG